LHRRGWRHEFEAGLVDEPLTESVRELSVRAFEPVIIAEEAALPECVACRQLSSPTCASCLPCSLMDLALIVAEHIAIDAFDGKVDEHLGSSDLPQSFTTSHESCIP